MYSTVGSDVWAAYVCIRHYVTLYLRKPLITLKNPMLGIGMEVRNLKIITLNFRQVAMHTVCPDKLQLMAMNAPQCHAPDRTLS